MKAVKAFAILFVFFFAISFAATSDANAQTLLPTANKIIYSTNAIEVQDSINKVAYVYKKGTVFISTKGYTGGTAAIIDGHSQRAVWRGPVAGIRIVGVVNSDSLKILSLKSTPY
ncbi:hypothetical protein [Spirosoma radiotolerans]|uniref:Uncharacterized protein n=1 Tax=Spirosoma radiotolerans TaxID=1379870 RepID=A0A0E3V713_9BACT|nr:hypothetical protein [Spirosoma radiotolerans]AKD55026.1 hypothetical protein SD10_09035 [Spirosoma radiotolerans]